MQFSEFLVGGADMSEAYLDFIIENYDKYIAISFNKGSRLVFKTFQSKEEMADSIVLNLFRKTNVYYFKKSDYDLFVRKGVDLHSHLHATGRNKELAKKLKERYGL